MNNKKLLLLGALLLAVGIGVGSAIALLTKSTKQASMQKAEKPPASLENPVRLSLSSSLQTLLPNQLLTLSVPVETDVELNGLELNLSWNPQALSLIEANPGTFFQNPIVFAKQLETKEGNLAYALGSLSPAKGKHEVASFTFKARSFEGTTTIELTKDSKVSAQGDVNTMLILPSSQTYTIVSSE